MRTIVVVDYDAAWPGAFERLRAAIWPAVRDAAEAIEHVGSTAVPGLAAKPIIDLDIVVRSGAEVPAAVARLAALGYAHRGNLGIEGREAFDGPPGPDVHHLYVCPRDSAALANHVAVRDYLRAHPDAAREYGELKKALATRFPHDIDAYVGGKADLLQRIMRAARAPMERA